MKLDFCPFEVGEDKKGYKKLDMDNLAYEMIFYDGYTYDDFKRAVRGTDIEDTLFTIGADIHQKDFNDGVTRYMMKAAKKGEKIGPEKLIELIEGIGEHSQKAVSEANIFDLEEDTKNSITGISRINLKCKKQEEGTYIIYDTAGREKPIAELIPCCPNCHNRLPMGFLTADDYIGVSLVAPVGGGKTTCLISMYVDNFGKMNTIGNGVQIIPAHYRASNVEIEAASGSARDIDVKAVDTFYEKRAKAAKELVEDGICPEITETVHIIKPTFLSIFVPDDKGDYHNMILGIYDNSGEVLEGSQARNEKIMMLSNMYAQIYLIEPEQIGVKVPEEASDSDVKSSGSITGELLSIEAQGRLQKENAGKVITGEELLEQQAEKPGNRNGKKKEYKKPMELLTKLNQDMVEIGNIGAFSNQHIAVTIIKCDKLEYLDVIKCVENSRAMFENREMNPDILWDENMAESNSDNYRRVFEELAFSGPEGLMNKREFNSVRFKSKSWHMISATGTRTKEIPGTNRYRLVGPYNPIRLEEPLVTCIIKRIKENGWVD